MGVGVAEWVRAARARLRVAIMNLKVVVGRENEDGITGNKK